MCADPKNAKSTIKLSVFFALLGSAHGTFAHKMLVKLTLGPREHRRKLANKNNCLPDQEEEESNFFVS